VALGQLGLFGHDAPHFDGAFPGLRRIELGAGAWLDHLPSCLAGHQQLFDQLERETRFRQERREMYEKVLDVPRLYAVLPEDGPGHPVVETMRRALSEHYAEAFTRVSLALYRDGRDSVAWHGDYVARNMETATVATLSLGAPRRFFLRPKGGGRSLAFSLGAGDLLVMGGTCQRTFQHSVPKLARAGSRIAVMFRPDWREG
jgi:alkylated DNA repair dioxygenase AlkB